VAEAANLREFVPHAPCGEIGQRATRPDRCKLLGVADQQYDEPAPASPVVVIAEGEHTKPAP